MLNFNFFDSNEWEVVSNEYMKHVIKQRNDYISELNTKIDNQSKEITRLLRAQEKLKAEIVGKEQIISSLDAKCNILSKKVRELNEGIHNSDDLSWKDKYEALKMSSDQAIAALQKKCVNKQYGVDSNTRDGYICELENRARNLEHNYHENYILRGKVKEISDLAETIVELCEDEE